MKNQQKPEVELRFSKFWLSFPYNKIFNWAIKTKFAELELKGPVVEIINLDPSHPNPMKRIQILYNNKKIFIPEEAISGERLLNHYNPSNSLNANKTQKKIAHILSDVVRYPYYKKGERVLINRHSLGKILSVDLIANRFIYTVSLDYDTQALKNDLIPKIVTIEEENIEASIPLLLYFFKLSWSKKHKP